MRKSILAIAMVVFFLYACSANKNAIATSQKDVQKTDTIRIASDSLEYEIVILEIGFNRYLNTQPAADYYGVSFLENKNYLYAAEYNRRVRDITRTRDLYPQEINYNPKLHYGKEVNYLLYNYFRFFEKEYKQKLK
ncbi:DUF6146 family protein [Patiriisocius sp. Uisw_017]|jgi:hypothetical protein|uniref:DUF6146 family protein n=1 Tax=Patiriisocius sp. Uisw_017 TaxID=3230968 RepID=UPI0039E9B2BC